MITTLHTFDTTYSADSIEWCPHENSREFFVCGTYQLENPSEQSQFSTKCNRKGRIYLFQFKLEDESLTKVFEIDTNAILDQKWHPTKNILTTADSKGFVTLYDMNEKCLKPINSLSLKNDDTENDLLALSLDWNNDGSKVIVSDSKGGVHVCDINSSKVLHHIPSIHSFEAWTCAWDKHNSNIFYTGGDDTFLNCYDTRVEPTFKWRNKSHGAGVTSLFSCSHIENALITGSYDEFLRFFDTRQTKTSVFDIGLGGGVWRIKGHAKDPNLLLTANMYHNFTVIGLEKDKFLINGSYFEHESICYGADWCCSVHENVKYFATCSFYDHKLCVAKYE